jgi:hypothetical protein
MSKERDGKHAGGGIVDTARANTSSEQIEKDNEKRLNEAKANRDKEDQS